MLRRPTDMEIWIKVGQRPSVLAERAGEGYLGRIICLFFLPISERRLDKDLNTVSKSR